MGLMKLAALNVEMISSLVELEIASIAGKFVTAELTAETDLMSRIVLHAPLPSLHVLVASASPGASSVIEEMIALMVVMREIAHALLMSSPVSVMVSVCHQATDVMVILTAEMVVMSKDVLVEKMSGDVPAGSV